MSLAIRIKDYVHISFMTFPNGLKLSDIEKIIEIHEGKYFDRHEAQSLIADCMCFLEKPKIEHQDITKFYSIDRRIKPFWKYQQEKYFLSDEKFKLTDEEKNILEDIRADSGNLKKYSDLSFKSISLIETLTNHPEGISFNNLYASFLDFNKKFNFYTDLSKDYNLNEDSLIEDSFIELMHFDSAEPYECVYLDKKDALKKRSFAHEMFKDWEYQKGLYYPTKEWLEKNEEGIVKSEKAISNLIRNIEYKTLLNFINEFCKLRKKSNSEFLREHLYIQANLDFSRK